MAVILDADVIIAGERGTLDLQNWLTSHSDEEFEIAAVTVAELWHGVERAMGRRRTAREQFLRVMLRSMPIIPYTEHTAFEHARLWAALESSGTMIGHYDLIVGATALERGSAIATFNTRHFTQIRGLKVLEPK